MKSNRFVWLAAGLIVGVTAAWFLFSNQKQAFAGNDRFEDYILCTGPVGVFPVGQSPTDGVWLLDYRSGKLLGTVINRAVGKIVGWAEVDLVNEFGIPPRQNVHFMMTTGTISHGQAALYVAETSTGKFGVYTLGPRSDNQSGFVIRRHDLVMFRQNAQQPNQPQQPVPMQPQQPVQQ